MREQLPPNFAIYRRKHNGNFYFQIIHAVPLGHRRDAYEIKEATWVNRTTRLFFGRFIPEGEEAVVSSTTLAMRSETGILNRLYPTRYQTTTYGFWHEQNFLPLVLFQNESWYPEDDLKFKVRTTMRGTEGLEHHIYLIRQQLLRRFLQHRPRESMSPPPLQRRLFDLGDDTVSDADSVSISEEEEAEAEDTESDISPIPPPYGDYEDLPSLETFQNGQWRRVQRAAPTVPLPLPKEVGETLIEAAIQRDEKCPILYNSLRDCDSVSITSCFHTFDTGALESWRSQEGICPMCRTRIVNVVSKRLRG